MTKRKPRRGQRRHARQRPRKLREALDEVTDLIEEGDYIAARARLSALVRQYPRSKPVLLALMEACYHLEDWSSVARYGEELLSLERGTDRAETLNNLVFAYSQLGYPALAWQAAQELIADHPDFPLLDSVERLAESAESLMRAATDAHYGSKGLSEGVIEELWVQQDRVRFYMESNQLEKGLAAGEFVLANAPHTLPVLNNMSMCHFLLGNVRQAIETAQQVLEAAPDNFHALANLTRYHFLIGETNTAEEVAIRLKGIVADDPDLEPKRAEALSFLGDDEAIRDAYLRAKKRKHDMTPLFLHLAAVAHYRLGDEKAAWRLWREALKLQPFFSLAQESLEDRSLPAGERNVPWYWPLEYWFPTGFIDELTQLVSKPELKKSTASVTKATRRTLDKYPHVKDLFPHVLELGDEVSRQFVVNLIRVADTPELIQVLLEFGKGPYGTDQLRVASLSFIGQEHPELLPENKVVRVWSRGRQTEVFLMGFEIHYDAEPDEHLADEVYDRHEEAYHLLMDNEAEAAELLLKEVVAAAPDFASAHNQLAVAYEMQGRREEAIALVKETHARFPDYLFSRVWLARIYALDKEIEAAKELLDPIMRLNRLHISEFRALAQAQMEIGLAEGNKDMARSWLNMWTQIEDDNPEVWSWQVRIEGADTLSRKLVNLLDLDE